LERSEPTFSSESGKNSKKKSKKKKRSKADKPNKWADSCMYAELLEMRDDDVWHLPGGVGDGLPEDLESGWVAVAPVPVGKRCLAVTHQSSGIVGVGAYALSIHTIEFAEVQ
jgi:snurportin-1